MVIDGSAYMDYIQSVSVAAAIGRSGITMVGVKC